jgi:hypothetical protein
MMKMRLALAVFVTVGLTAPYAEARKSRPVKHNSARVLSPTYGTAGVPVTQPRTYGTSGTSVGTVTAPSVGSYNWPSVGVTNSVPTWSNTNPPAR